MDNIYCSHCGVQNESQNKYCTNCGNAFITKSPNKKISKEEFGKKVPQPAAKLLNETKDKKNIRIFWFIVVVIILIIYYSNMNGHSSSNNVSSSNGNQMGNSKFVASDLKNSAFVISQQFVTNRLKSPSTADFPLLDFTCVANDADSTFKVISYVDSQNGFGATIRTHYQVTLKYKGGDVDDYQSWELLDLNWQDTN